MKKDTVKDSIGRYFTRVYLEKQGNPKLEGFADSAEFCRRDSNMKRNGKVLGWLAILLASTVLGFSFFEPVNQDDLIAVGAVGIVGIIVLIINNFFKDGETRVSLVGAWKPIRRKLMKHGVIQTACRMLKKDKADCIGDDEIRKVLVKAFDSSMETLFNKLRKAEREGFPKKTLLIQDQIKDLKSLTREMGLIMRYREDGSPSNGSAINCTNNPRDKRHSLRHGDPIAF
jgi:hypothetical protein